MGFFFVVSESESLSSPNTLVIFLGTAVNFLGTINPYLKKKKMINYLITGNKYIL